MKPSETPSKAAAPSTAPPSRTLFFTREAWRRVWRSKRTSSVAIIMITIALLTVGIFLLASENLVHAVQRWQGSSKITLYFTEDATPDAIQSVDAQLDASGLFPQRRHVSSEESLQNFKATFGGLAVVVDELGSNPFPPSLVLELGRNQSESPEVTSFLSELALLPSVDDIQHDGQWVSRVRNAARMLNLIGLIAGGVLSIAAAFTTANVIRLSLVLYREEIAIMRLIGATEAMIRGPFLIQGALQGLIGGVVAVALLGGLFLLGEQLIASSSAMVWDVLFSRFLSWQKLAAMVACGILAGLIGSWLSLSEARAEMEG
jgi:cell division transport system permease protein